MSLKIDSSNERSLFPQNQDEPIIKKDAVVEIGISSYESKDAGNNWGEEIWRPDGTKKFLHPILGDRWSRVQTASTNSKDDTTCCPPPHDREIEPYCKTFDREPHCKEPTPFDKEPYCKVPHDKEPPCYHDKEPPY